MKLRIVFLATVVALSSAAQAAVLDITPVGTTFADCVSCTTFEGRGIYFHANDTFTVSQIGWVGDIVGGDFTIAISAGAGVNAAPGPTLASFNQSAANAGYTTNWFNTPFTFTAGNDYHVNLAYTDGSVFSTRYDYQDWDMSSSNLGQLTLLDGTSYPTNAGGGTSNFWLTHFMMNVGAVPEPESYAMAFSGLAFLWTIRKTKRA